MKTATDKQALYINRLSYKLYRLNGCNNTKVIMTYRKALGLSYDIAEEMIDTLTKKVIKQEKDQYLEEVIKTTDYVGLDHFPTLKMVENFKKIDKFKVDTEKGTANITTVDGKEYNLSGDKLRKHDFDLTYKGLYFILKNAIDNDLEVGILETDKYIIITPINEINEYYRDKYQSKIALYNKVIELTEGMLPITENKAINTGSFEILLGLAQRVDLDLYEELQAEYKLDKFKGLYDLLIKATTHEYNIISSNREVLIG